MITNDCPRMPSSRATRKSLCRTLHLSLPLTPSQIEPITVQRIGELLMTNYVWPLQCVGVLLTAALIGALILVMEEKS